MWQRTDFLTPVVHSQSMSIKGKAIKLMMVAAMALSLAPLVGSAQQTPMGQMKASGTEVGKAGKSMGRNVRRGRVVRGGKHFGKHIGRAGKHFGRGTKKAVKRVFS